MDSRINNTLSGSNTSGTVSVIAIEDGAGINPMSCPGCFLVEVADSSCFPWILGVGKSGKSFFHALFTTSATEKVAKFMESADISLVEECLAGSEHAWETLYLSICGVGAQHCEAPSKNQLSGFR